MKLNRLGDYIIQTDNRNHDLRYKTSDVRGISTAKCFIFTKANLKRVSLRNYKIVNTHEFAYVADTSRRGNKIGLAYQEYEPCIISSIYTSFKISKSGKLLPEYLMMVFKREEFDRYARFNSWGSARETFSWEDFCNIKLIIPNIEIQRKYVAIYKGLQDNLKSYEKGLKDLKLVCDGYIEKIRRENGTKKLKDYIVENKNKNRQLTCTNPLGISNSGFIKPNQKPGKLSNYTLFNYNYFVYSPPRINVGSIDLYKKHEEAISSPIYVSFKVKDEATLNPDYLMLWLRRKEFLRSTDFFSIGSVRNNFSYDILCETKIGFPTIDIQRKLAELSRSINIRRAFLLTLRDNIRNICPVLIKGAVEESLRDN